MAVDFPNHPEKRNFSVYYKSMLIQLIQSINSLTSINQLQKLITLGRKAGLLEAGLLEACLLKAGLLKADSLNNLNHKIHTSN